MFDFLSYLKAAAHVSTDFHAGTDPHLGKAQGLLNPLNCFGSYLAVGPALKHGRMALENASKGADATFLIKPVGMAMPQALQSSRLDGTVSPSPPAKVSVRSIPVSKMSLDASGVSMVSFLKVDPDDTLTWQERKIGCIQFI